MMRTLGFALLVSASLISAACGGDDDDDDDGSSNGSTAGKGGNGSAGKGGAGSGAFDPESCSPMMMMTTNLPAGCTQAQIDEYTSCVSASCEPTLEMCYGPDYESGTYAGPCKEQLDCATKSCACNDNACIMNCPGAQMCVQCFASKVCGTDCKIPTCGLTGALADSGINVDFDKTCDDLLACCATLAGEDMTECTSNVNSIKQAAGANADLGCAALFPVFAMGSTDPACM
jgi:hypothetical protein